MADASKLHGVVLANTAGKSWSVRSYREPRDIEDAFRYWVHRCCSINASVAASVPYKLVSLVPARQQRMLKGTPVRPLGRETRRLMKGEAEVRAPFSWQVKQTRHAIDDVVEVTQHPILDLLANANRWTDGFAMLEGVYHDLQLSGRHFSFVSKRGRTPTELTRMMPYYVEPVPDPVDFVSGFTYRHGAEERLFDPDEVLWVRRFDPTNPWGGVGELQAWCNYVDASAHIAEFNKWLMERHGAPDYVVTGSDGMTEDDKRAFRSRWRTLFGRLFKRQESVAFMTGNASLERLTQSNRELEFTESSRLVRDFVAAGFGVPKALLTPEDANRAVTKEATDQHLRLTVWPMVCRVFDAMNDQLVPQFGGRMLLMPENPIRQDAADTVAERESRLRSGSTVNEVRAEEGLEPHDDPSADEPLVVSGLTPLSRVTAEPAQSPAGGPQEPADEPEDEPDPEDAEDAKQPEDEQETPGEAGERAWRAGAEQWAAIVQRCGCINVPVGKTVSIRDLWVPPVVHVEDLGPLVKRLESTASSDVAAISRAIRPAMASVRSMLDAMSRKQGFDLAAVLDSGDLQPIYEQAGRMARDSLISTMSERVREAGQGLVNAAVPGRGLAFNMRDPRVAEYIERSADRIAQTAVQSFLNTTLRRSATLMDEGGNVATSVQRAISTGHIERYVSERIARTEAQYATTFSQSAAWDQSPTVIGKRFVLSPDPCPLCQSAADSVGDKVFEPMGTVFEEGMRIDVGNGRTVVLDYAKGGLLGPPLHPNCRCSIEEVLIGEA
jgi:HK97 family phage portal protein